MTWDIIQTIIDKEVGSGSGSDSGFGTAFGSELITELERDRTLCYEILGIDSQERATIEAIDRAFTKQSLTEHPDKAGKTGKEEANRRFQVLEEAKEWLEKNCNMPSSLYIRSSNATWIDTFYQQAVEFNIALPNGALTWGIIKEIINREVSFAIDRTLCCAILGIQEDERLTLVAVENACLKACREACGSIDKMLVFLEGKKWLDNSLNSSSFKNNYERSRDASWIDTFYQQAVEFKVTLPKQELTWGIIQTIIDKSVEARLQQLQT